MFLLCFPKARAGSKGTNCLVWVSRTENNSYGRFFCIIKKKKKKKTSCKKDWPECKTGKKEGENTEALWKQSFRSYNTFYPNSKRDQMLELISWHVFRRHSGECEVELLKVETVINRGFTKKWTGGNYYHLLCMQISCRYSYFSRLFQGNLK